MPAPAPLRHGRGLVVCRASALGRRLTGVMALSLLSACDAAVTSAPPSPAAPPAATAVTNSLTTTSAAAEQPLATPPLDYRLAELELRLTRRAGHGVAPLRRLVLGGQGSGTLALGADLRHFAYPASELLALVNALHQLRFFALPERYSQHQSVFLRGDGRVGLSLQRPLDTETTELCFSLPGFEKCVAYDHLQAPAELDALAQRLLQLAEQRSKP